MTVAVLSLGGLLLSVYLTLHRYGLTGPLACGDGVSSCERVQASQYADFAGVPVALIGVAGYLGLLAVSLLGLQPRWIGRREPTLWLALLSGLGVGFTAYLKYLEIFRIHAICRWCLGSAVIITVIFVASVVALRKARATA